MNIVRNTSLYFKQGSSDKVYQAQINEIDDGYTVTFAYGRRGSALKNGCKTPNPIALEKAEKLFNKLVKEKQSKGYTKSEDGQVFTQSVFDKAHSGVYCQLLNPIEKQDAMILCSDDAFCIQQKHDGERRLIQKTNSQILGINRKGIYVDLTLRIAEQAEHIPSNSFVIDGEDMGDHIYVWDILEYDGNDIRNKPYSERYQLLSDLMPPNDCILVTKTAFSTQDKLELLGEMVKQSQEGIVLKRLDAPYSSGRPNSGGDQLKHKFYETCSVVVDSHNQNKRSVAISGIDGETSVCLGNVTIPPNHDMPNVGDIIEVKYLYAYAGGSLYQPVYLGKRNDLFHQDCTITQLKYKPDCAA